MNNNSTYFISHGAPDIGLRNTQAAEFLRTMNPIFKSAKAILVISAHWLTEEPMITAHPAPETIYDFGGFPRQLYSIEYNAAGSPELAQKIKNAVAPVFPLAELDFKRGRDHGSWMPLHIGFPQASVPVLQLSVQPHKNAQHHFEVGKRLKEQRDNGVLIMASGNATHNLREVFNPKYLTNPNDAPPKIVTDFNDWLFENLQNRDDKALLNWETQAPNAAWNHPTTEHFLPLFTALGAADEKPAAKRLHASYDYNVLSMDSYSF